MYYRRENHAWATAQTAAFIWFVLGVNAVLADPIESFTEPFRKIDIAPAEPGTIASIAVNEGDAVVKGQVLAVLDCDTLLIGLQVAKANIESRGKSDAATAERDLRAMRLEKLKALRERENASQDEVDRARTDAEISEANLQSVREQHTIDELEFKKIEALIERRAIRSPIDGTVTRVYREEREFVSTNNPAVVTVVQLDRLRSTFSISSMTEAKLTVGQTVPLYFPETNDHAQGTVEFVAPLTDAESGTVRVKILLNNERGQWRCGARCVLDPDDFSASAEDDVRPLRATSTKP